MRQVSIALVLAVVLFLGCQEEPPPPEPVEEPPPEPTADDIYNEMKTSVQVLWRPMTGGGALQVAEIEPPANALRAAKAKNMSYQHLPEANSRMRRDLEDLIRDSDKNQRWRVLKAACLAFEALEPGSTRYKRMIERADIMMARPFVKVLGFSTVDDQTYIMFQVTDAITQEISNRTARVGEELVEGVRVEEILGGNQAVRLNYLPVNDSSWITPGPSEMLKEPAKRQQFQ
ncbi:MAG TPA: hypothetical protein PKI11_00620 [Candidatus Hydrogenedentes bacterium]|nr:hypothetical protein [Candidatus Hydrogenedentota bacterium]